ncbi:MAG: hypothetical protein RJQ04_05925 [Longimicrobiales bacterium]
MNAAVLVVLSGLAFGPQSDEVGRTERIRFHSDAWVNLHHFLYQWARAEEGIGTGRQAVEVPERDDVDRLAPGQHAAWRAAVDFYREHLAAQGHFDSDMLRIKAALLDATASGTGAAGALRGVGPPGVGPVLDAAMEVYRTVWWPGHDRANRAWIAELLPMAQRFESRYVPLLERSYGGTFDHEVRLDATTYGNWAGGYTSNRPPHTVVLSTDPRNQGLYGLELIYHEVSHTSPLGRPNVDGVDQAFAALDAEPPSNLWHAIIFYAAGWTTRGIARDLGLPEHVPYAVNEGLTGFRGWEGLWPALEEHWAPVLEGRSTREEALERLARALAG